MAKHLPIELIHQAASMVNECEGNQNEAARRLGLARSCLRRRIDTAILSGVYVCEGKPRKAREDRPGRAPIDPTPDEIADHCATFVRQRPRRRFGIVRWQIPAPGRRFTEMVEAAE